jgi:hypothetical protein
MHIGEPADRHEWDLYTIFVLMLISTDKYTYKYVYMDKYIHVNTQTFMYMYIHTYIGQPADWYGWA